MTVIPMRGALPCSKNPEAWFIPARASDEYLAEHNTTREEHQEQFLRTRLICMTECPVRKLCLKIGMDEEFGVWGGYTDIERRSWEEGTLRTKVPPRKTPPDEMVKCFTAGGTVEDIRAAGWTHAKDVLRILTAHLWRLRFEAGDFDKAEDCLERTIPKALIA